MAVLDPAVAAVRTAVRRALAGLSDGELVLVACSGGGDSLALAEAVRFAGARQGVRCGLITIDHDLQAGSAARAADLAGWATATGYLPVIVSRVAATAGPGGPEAVARRARYAALVQAAKAHRAAAVLLGHTRDDQAETVLLALARGAGSRGLSGMPTRRVLDGVPFLRPLLDVGRAQTRAACAGLDRVPWQDPHNEDPAFARTRVRAALPVLAQALGPDVVANLARTARLLAADTAALDALAETVVEGGSDADGALALAALAGLPDAVRTRALHAFARRAGAAGGALSHRHVDALDCLVTAWRGQGPVALPGGIQVARRGDRLRAAPPSIRGHRYGRLGGMADGNWHAADIDRVIVAADQIRDRTDELAKQVGGDHADVESLLLICVLKGALMFMADFARALGRSGPPVELDFMAISSYGQGTNSSGVVRILKDLDRDIAGRHVLVVEDIVDSGLTLSWLLRYLASRSAASVDVVALLRKPDAVKVDVPVRYVGFDIPNEFVVGYGLDYNERYRDLPFVGVLKPSVYARS